MLSPPEELPAWWQALGNILPCTKWASLVAEMVKNPPAVQETWVPYLGWEDPLEEGIGNPLQYSCLDNPHGQRILVGYSSRVHKELDTTEQLSTAHTK